MRAFITTGAVGLLVFSALPVRAEVTVRLTAGKVDITASNAPLSEVLQSLADQTGMKVIYEGEKPRDLVTAALPGRSPVEAITDLLKERELNYALAVDATGRVNTLIIVTGGQPQVARDMAPPMPAAPPVPPAPAVPPVHSLLDLLTAAGSPIDESLKAELEAADASQPDVKPEDVFPPELLERWSAPTVADPAAIPEGSLLKLLLEKGQLPGIGPPAAAAPADKPAGAAVNPKPKPSPPDPAEPPLP